MSPLGFEADRFFFHYTTREAAFGSILPSRALRLSTYRDMRDPLENQRWRFTFAGRGPRDTFEILDDLEKQTDFEQQANEQTRDRSHLLSLTVDAEESPDGERAPFCFRWARARMWEQYAERHRGVCLAFDRKRLRQRFDEALAGAGAMRLYHQPVIYDGAGVMSPIIEFDALRSSEDFFSRYVEANAGALFFTKALDWQTEHEYRFVVVAADGSPVSIDYGDALRWVIVGDRSPEWERPSIITASRQADAQALLLRWHNGRPGLVELHGRPGHPEG
jgi:hypothetical protein